MLRKLAPAPNAPRSDVVENLHGQEIADPFRPLEDLEAEKTKVWIEAQDRRSRAFLDALPSKGRIEAFLRRVWDYPKMGVPVRYGTRYFYWLREGMKPQNALAWRDGLDGEQHILIDPSELSDDGTVALSGWKESHDGESVAYLLAEAGSDVVTLRIRNVASGRDYPEIITWCKFTSIAWRPDNRSFLYNRCLTPEEAPEGRWDLYYRVYLHRLGQSPEQDELIIEAPGVANRKFFPMTFPGGRYHGLYFRDSLAPQGGFRIAAADEELTWHTVVEPGLARFWPIGVAPGDDGDRLYAITDLNAPNFRLVALPPGQPEVSNWTTVIPESDDVLAYGVLAGGRLVICKWRDAEPRLFSFGLPPENDVRGLTLPAGSTASLARPHPEDRRLLLGVTSYRSAQSIYSYDLDEDRLEIYRESAIPEDLRDCVVERVFARSRDDTRIPMWLIHRPDIMPAPDTPAFLTAYGGYGNSRYPGFSFPCLNWVRNGGLYVVASIRGGQEYGAKWHDAARGHATHNRFDDFIACAEWLIDNKLTSVRRLAIVGGSHGGLLVTACMLQRPDLFGAVVSMVPVTDMLRFHRFTVGGAWVSEYGSPDDPEDFSVLRAYSPLHNVDPETAYPPILITTGDHDDRVAPLHAYKLAATLQECGHPDNKVLLRVDRRAGHGMGKPTEKIIAEIADIQAFLTAALGIEG